MKRSVVRGGAFSMALFLTVLLFVPMFDLHAQPATPSSVRGTVVFIDFEQVFTNYFKTRLANDQLLEMSDSINRERAVMLTEYDQLQKVYAGQRAKLLSPEVEGNEADKLRIALDETLLSMKRQEEKIEAFNKTQDARWVEQNRRIRGTLVEDIQKKLHSYMKAMGYLAVFDRSQMNDKKVPAVLYVDDAADVTKAFIDALNK